MVACSPAEFSICRCLPVARLVSGVRDCVCVSLTFGRWLFYGCSIQEFSLEVRQQAKWMPALQYLVYSCG